MNFFPVCLILYIKLNKTFELIQIPNARVLTAVEGEDWKLQRKILSSAFHYDL